MLGEDFMKKIMTLSMQMFMSAVFMVGGLISSGACFGTYYQPEVPEKLRIEE